MSAFAHIAAAALAAGMLSVLVRGHRRAVFLAVVLGVTAVLSACAA